MALRAVSQANTALNSSQIVGTTTNDNAAAGIVGEFIESQVLLGSAVPLTNATIQIITQIALTAGDWDVFGNVAFHPGATTVVIAYAGWITTAVGTYPGLPNKGGTSRTALGTGLIPNDEFSASGLLQRISIASTTTVYLYGIGYFTTSTLAGYGYIGARRAR